ncbi:unnamed protein product [Meloidogyne enterolobii]|uniref:Uncharacterized protein n=1 Tax=Meloidogyne enterolobii TaxID=390850 RepID=A0ACB0YDW7_MELEN
MFCLEGVLPLTLSLFLITPPPLLLPPLSIFLFPKKNIKFYFWHLIFGHFVHYFLQVWTCLSPHILLLPNIYVSIFYLFTHQKLITPQIVGEKGPLVSLNEFFFFPSKFFFYSIL